MDSATFGDHIQQSEQRFTYMSHLNNNYAGGKNYNRKNTYWLSRVETMHMTLKVQLKEMEGSGVR